MPKIRKQYEKGFTTLDNTPLNDKNLTWKAKGLFAYLWSKPDDWDYRVTEVARHSKDGVGSTSTGVNELEKAGYLQRKQNNDHGVFGDSVWTLSEKPIFKKPITENPRSDNPITDKPYTENRPLLNTDELNTDLTNKRDTKTNSASHSNAQSVSQLEKEFEEVWSKYPNKKGKKQAFNHYKAWRRKSTKHTNEYLLKKLDEYIRYVEQRRRTGFSSLSFMNGSTWFNGRFDDELEVDNPTPANKYEQEGYYDDYKDFVRDDGKGDNLLNGVSDDELPF